MPEHIADRLTQVRDEFANLVEESVSSRRLNLFNRFDGDISDLLRVDPQNTLARDYWHEMNHEQPHPPFILPQAPAGVPQWAFLQVEDLGYLKRLINWYIDNRQISNGEFGGGLSDDQRLYRVVARPRPHGRHARQNQGVARSKEMDAMYAQHMFTNGLATIQTDELHSYEDGLNVLSEYMMLDFGSPKQIERAMVTAKRLEWLTGINDAGHRHVRSNYFNGAKMAEGGVWGWSKEASYMDFHPALSLVLFNGMPETRKMILELADGILAHYKPGPDGKPAWHLEVNFKTDEDKPTGIAPGSFSGPPIAGPAIPSTCSPSSTRRMESMQQVNADTLDMLDLRKIADQSAHRCSRQGQRSGPPSRSRTKPSGSSPGRPPATLRISTRSTPRRFKPPRARVHQHRGQPLDRSHLLQQRRAAALAPRRRRAHAQLLLSRQCSQLAIRCAGELTKASPSSSPRPRPITSKSSPTISIAFPSPRT